MTEERRDQHAALRLAEGGGTDWGDDRIPLALPTIEDDDVTAAVAVLRSGWLTSGPEVSAFEHEFTRDLDGKHAVAVSSASAGLHLALAALGVGPGADVVTTSFTWPSTVNVIQLLGARPVFADVTPDTLLIDPVDVARKITDRTRAIIPVHFSGAPADMDALRDVISGLDIAIVHDAAHALGTAYKGRQIAAEPDVAVFSFHPTKNITSGEGGMVTTGDLQTAERIRRLRFHGLSRDSWSRHQGHGPTQHEVLEPGWKYIMSDLHAAVGRTQLTKLGRFNARRSELVSQYHELLGPDAPYARPVGIPLYPHTHAWHLYVLRLNEARLSVDRDEFVAGLHSMGIGAGIHFMPVHLHHFYRTTFGFEPGCLPATETAGRSVLSLPLYPSMTEAHQERVAVAVRALIHRYRTSERSA